MRYLGALAPVASIVVVAWIVWSIIGDGMIPGSPKRKPAAPFQRRAPVVAQAAQTIAPPPRNGSPAPPEGEAPVARAGPGADSAGVPRPDDEDAPPHPAEAAAAPATGPLCDRRFDAAQAPRVALPKGEWVRVLRHPLGKERWRWVSLWAAWCKPCIEEMPLIARWSQDAPSRPAPLFVSLDDDERQLRRYLTGTGRALDADVLWVQDEAARRAFFEALGVDDPPTLPVQALLDPQGRLRCVRVGSVGAADLARAAETFDL